jgi:hypothetical protein
VEASSLAQLAGTVVEGRGLRVESVPADKGFWASCGPARIWVRLVGSGELRRRLAEDSRLSLVGVVVPHGAGFAATQGVDAAEGGAGLDGQGFHVDVAYSDLEQ